MEVIRRALAAPPRKRQAAASTDSISDSSPSTSSIASESSSPSVDDTTTSTDASASSGTAAAATATSTIFASSAIAEVTSDGPNGPTTIFSIISPPPHTATSSTPYAAPGINATSSATTTRPPSTPSSSSSSTSTTSTYVDPAQKAIESASAPGIPKNQLTACQINGTWHDASPFCSPDQGQGLWVGFTYALTWNPALFSMNASNVAQLQYADKSLGNVWTSEPVPNVQGYVDVQISKDWLKGASGNDSTSGQNASLVMISTPIGAPNVTKIGPPISLIVDPKSLPPVLLPKISNKYGLEIGLPIGVVALLLIGFSICCGIRRHNKNHRSTRGIAHDYMAKRARRRGKGDIALNEYASQPSVDQYTDQPLQGGAAGGNQFRDEIARQRAEDDASVKRFPSSF